MPWLLGSFRIDFHVYKKELWVDTHMYTAETYFYLLKRAD